MPVFLNAQLGRLSRRQNVVAKKLLVDQIKIKYNKFVREVGNVVLQESAQEVVVLRQLLR